MNQPNPSNGETSPDHGRVASVRMGPLLSIPALLEEFGCDADAVLKPFGLSKDRFRDPEMRIPYATGSRLIARCVAATGCEHFGLRIGMRAGGSSLGLAGFMLASAPNVGTALGALVKHLALHDDGGVLALETIGKTTLLGYEVVEPKAVAVDQICDLSVAVACNIMRALCGPDWNPGEVLLSHRAPRDRKPFERFFRAPLRFDAGRCAIAFPARSLDRVLPGADPLLFRHLESQALQEQVLRKNEDLGELRRSLRSLLAAGRCSASEAARRLGIHERTLNRRLRSEGTTFHSVLDEVRYETARQLLGHSNLTLGEIAAALQYSESSAFNRAFKRWSGITPARWRDDQRLTPDG